MFDKFGEMNLEELNRAAAAQLAEGDTEALIALAVENGLDQEDAEDYIDGCSEMLASPFMAAVGKINLEAKELQLEGLIADWKDYILQSCIEDVELCKAVREKGKSLEKCLGELLKFAFNAKKKLNDNIAKAAGLRTPIYLGVPSKAEALEIIRKYYMEGES